MSINEILAALNLDSSEIKCYLKLLQAGPETAGKLSRKIGIARTSLYGVLGRLIEQGLISESLYQGKKLFIAEPPEKITLLFGRQIEELKNYQDKFKEVLPILKKNTAKKLMRPKLEMLEGATGLQSVLKDMLLYYDLQTFALWPIKSMLKALSPEYFRYLNKERIRNNLYTRAIWPSDHGIDLKSHPYLGVGKEFKREIRIAPSSVVFSMGYWCYGSKTAFISSQKENIGFLIDSEELAQTLAAQFEVLWQQAQPLLVNSKDTDSFLKELDRY